ncbi:MAG: PQQ-dependent sugar dehydrogenase [Nitrospira sp.]|nr:PQQ-dependent sugar dehydrogenase [Nitrospira sp.]
MYCKTILEWIIQSTVAIILVTIPILPLGCGEDPTTQTTTTSTTTTTLPVSLGLQNMVTGLSFPVFLTTPPGDNNRLFIVEKRGTIRIIKNGVLLGTSFLDINSLVSTGGEQGLLGLAFDPNYATNGRFYVSYTDTSGDSQIVRYLVSSNPDIAQATADRVLLSIDQPFDNHNGGDIAFGPDGYLYIAMGDGGSGNDPQGNGQDLTDLLGSLLRIDVSPAGNYVIPNDNPFKNVPLVKEELWNYGLRNPWRFSFDRQTGDLYIADVGQGAREEINVALAILGRGKGLNYGWNIMEGTICTPGVNPNCSMVGLTLPVLDYTHGDGCSVTGGYVYRGSAIPTSRLGTYFYADYCSGWIRSFRYQNGQATAQTQWPRSAPEATSLHLEKTTMVRYIFSPNKETFTASYQTRSS